MCSCHFGGNPVGSFYLPGIDGVDYQPDGDGIFIRLLLRQRAFADNCFSGNGIFVVLYYFFFVSQPG